MTSPPQAKEAKEQVNVKAYDSLTFDFHSSHPQHPDLAQLPRTKDKRM